MHNVMPKLIKLLLFALPMILVLMTAIVSSAYYKSRKLSLPISDVLAVFAIILPTSAGASIIGFHKLLKQSWKDYYQPLSLPILALFTIQLVYEIIIFTLSLNYIFPLSALDCSLTTRWQVLFKNENEKALQAIQDSLNCCGLVTVRDRAWPISRNSPSPCSEIFGRSLSCLVPWRKAEQSVGVMILVNVIVVLMTRMFAVYFLIKKSARRNKGIHAIDEAQAEEDSNVGFGRLLIKDNNPGNAFRDEPEPNAIRDEPLPNEFANEGPVGWNFDPSSITEGGQMNESRNHWNTEEVNS